ncbi:MAG: hypothetical protein ACYTG0_40110 [Planctomycetota bacterium]|jgi:hypothetical protein
MLARLLLTFVVTTVVVTSAEPVAAGDAFQEFCHNVIQDFKRNNCWPQPFVRADRASIRAPFALMVKNGWRRQNMLADHHFRDGTALNEAGQIKVRWIMTEAPRHHRTIYLRRADGPGQTTARMETVRQLAQRFTEKGQAPEIVLTGIDASGWPAARIDMIERGWSSSSPQPRLPANQASAGGGSGGS